MDGAAKLIFLLISGIARPHKLSWLVPSYHLIPERFENQLDAAGIEPRSLCFVSSVSHRFIHDAMASRVDQNFINTLKKVDPSFWKKRGNDFV